jgi:hypothetical protein
MRQRVSLARQLVAPIVTTLVVVYFDVQLGHRLRSHARIGWHGADVLWLTAALSPNGVALGLWLAYLYWRRQNRGPQGGARVTTRGAITEARPLVFSPSANALTLVTAAALPLALIVAFVTDWRPSLTAATGTLALVVALGLVELLRSWAFQRSGAANLVIDRVARTLTVPRERIRDPPRRISWSDVEAVIVDVPATPPRTRRRRGSLTDFTVALRLAGAGGRVPIGRWPDRPPAERFRAWLEGELSRSA